MPARIAIVVATRIKEGLPEEVAADRGPSRDYLELIERLEATLIHQEEPKDWLTRAIWKLLGRGPAHAWIAFARRREYEVVHTLSDEVGLPLAILFKLAGVRRRHVMVAHHLTPRKKQLLFRLLRVQSHIDKLVVYSSPQQRLAVNQLHIPADKVELVLHPADHHFWRPAGMPQRSLICSAGLEYRDYPTLLKAVEGLPVQVVIAAASPWSRRDNETADRTLPANVSTVSLTPQGLRELYNRAAFVVVPLRDVTFQAGSLVMYEAMACGKAVVATRTRGQEDIVRPGETGLYVPPGDVEALRRVICELLEDPERSEKMGRSGRAVVEAGLNLEEYVTRVCQIVGEVAGRVPEAGADLYAQPASGRA